jgi:hypothetical protein
MLVAYSAWTLVVLLAVLPIAHHMMFGRSERRREILDFFDDDSIKEYFKRFYHAQSDTLGNNPRGQLSTLYDRRFGLRSFILPVIVYLPTLALAVTAIVYLAMQPVFGVAFPSNVLNPLVGYALAGAYLWVVSDLLARWRQRDIGPSALFSWTFRFVISVPLAMTLAAVLKDQFVPPLAFLLGVFPTSTLLLFLRRQAAQRLKLGDDVESSKNELESLQGINTTIAEKFAEIGITTLVQLAYEDPIQLAMRLSLPFIFILDVVAQALAGLYFKDLEITRRYSIRGAIESFFLYEQLKSEDGAKKAQAEKVRDDMAADLKISPQTLEIILMEIAEDPATRFLEKLPY